MPSSDLFSISQEACLLKKDCRFRKKESVALKLKFFFAFGKHKDMVADASIWRLLNPDESIEENAPLQPTASYRLTSDEVENQSDLLKQDGYCYIPSAIDTHKVDRMLACVRLMIRNGIPPVFCFVYDIFWQLILDLDPILREVLHGDYHVIQNAWTWV